MKSLERRFNNIVKENPYWSDYTCFAVAVTGQKFGGKYVRKWFNKLVDKNDYARRDKDDILKHLLMLNNKLTEPDLGGENAQNEGYLPF